MTTIKGVFYTKEQYDALVAERDEFKASFMRENLDCVDMQIRAEAAEAEVARLEDAIYECLPIIEHGLSGGSAGDALRHVGRKLAPMVARAALAKEDVS